MTIYSLLRFWGVDLHFVKMLIALSSVFDMIGLRLGNLLYRKISKYLVLDSFEVYFMLVI